MLNKNIRILLAWVGLFALSGPSVAATYVYSGGSFTEVAGNYSKLMRIWGQFTTDTPLPSNLNSSGFLPGDPNVYPVSISGMVTSYSFFDGVQWLTDTNSRINRFSVATDASGGIIYWNISLWAAPVTTTDPGGTVDGIDVVYEPNDWFPGFEPPPPAPVEPAATLFLIQENGFTNAQCVEFFGPGGECSSVDLIRGNYGLVYLTGIDSLPPLGNWRTATANIAPVPSLGEYARIMLILLLAALGATFVRRHYRRLQ